MTADIAAFFLRAFLTLFVVIDPIGLVPIFISLAGFYPSKLQLQVIRQALLVAAGILLIFALFGNALLRYLGISVEAFQVAGGILLLKIAIDMVFAQHERETEAEAVEARERPDISVFPLATPLIAGPGALTSVLILENEAVAYPFGTWIVIGITMVVLLILYGSLAIARPLSRWLGQTGINVVSRILGILLAALAIQYIVDGLLALVEAAFKI